MRRGHLVSLRSIQGVFQLRATYIAEQSLGRSILDDRVALVLVLAHDALESADVETRGWERDDLGGHDLRYGDVECVFFFIVEEWVAIEPNGSVGDTAMAEAFADGFCYPYYNLSLGELRLLEH
jgi:hypothetical protein